MYTIDPGRVKHPYVMCDKNRLNRVLLNLVSNAYRFMLSGGTVGISLSENEDARKALAAMS